MARHPIVAEDCARALERTRDLWAPVAGRRLFVTGGTGFFGTWLLELLTYAADTLSFDCEAVILTRDPAAYAKGVAGHVARHRCVRMLAGDVRTFALPGGTFDYVVHFGSTGAKKFHDEQPEAFFDLVVDGTRRVLDLAVQSGASRFLLASTGAVYGRTDMTGGVSEDFSGAPDSTNPSSANGEAKRVAEFLTACASRRHPALATVIARGFAFIGPYLPAHAGFAAYDFARDIAAGRRILVKGDGTPIRSYLYGSDLAVWLWTLLLRAQPGSVWNVGSAEPVSIRELAAAFARAAGRTGDFDVAAAVNAHGVTACYLPNPMKARRELGLAETVCLDEAVFRTLAWFGN